MNQVELLQGELAAMSSRVRRLEVIFLSRGVTTDDTLEAEAVATELGFDVDVVYLPRNSGTKTNAKKRRELARRLHREKKWSSERIARALGCYERSVRRWLD